jgi:hypothetical protein
VGLLTSVMCQFRLLRWNQDPNHSPKLSEALQSTLSLDLILEDDRSNSFAFGCMHRPRTQCTLHHLTALCLCSLYTPLYIVVDSKSLPSFTPSPSSLSLSLVLPRSPLFSALVTFGTLPQTGLCSPFGQAVLHFGPFLIVSLDHDQL